MIDELGYPVTPERIEQLQSAFMFQSDTTSREVGLIVDALTARIAALEAVLCGIVNTLGPTSCKCEGLQLEVDMALEQARAALAGPTDRNEQAAQLLQALPRDCAGCWRCQPESHPKPPGLKTRRAGAPEDLPSTTSRESYPATIIVTEVRRGEPVVYPDETVAPECRDGWHAVMAGDAACQCGENRMELLL